MPTPLRFVLEPGEDSVLKPNNRRRISDSILSKPAIAGVTLRPRIGWFKDATAFRYLDDRIARCAKLGKLYTILIKGGEIGDYHAAHKRTIERYTFDPLYWGHHLTGGSPTGVSEELHHKNITSAILITNYRLIDTICKSLLPAQKLLIAGSPKDPNGCYGIVMYAVIKRGGNAGVVPKHNSMQADTEPLAPQNQLLYRCRQELGVDIGWEDACAAADDPSRYGGTYAEAEKLCAKWAVGQNFYYHGTYRNDALKL